MSAWRGVLDGLCLLNALEVTTPGYTKQGR